jgi:glutathione synthase
VFHSPPEDDNLNALLEMFAEFSREPIIAQAYIPAVRAGDKRIILIDGKPVGAVNRVPAAGDVRANMHAGGRAEKTELSKTDLMVCEAIGPALSERGLLFTGIDVIGDRLTEINVTSPTGLQEIGRFDDVSLEVQLWDAIEARYEATRHPDD